MIQNAGTEEATVELSANGQRMFQQIENSHKPFVAAIHGMALGGGLEVISLQASHYLAI